MTERIGIWIESASPGLLGPLWQRFRGSPVSVRLAKGVFWSLVGATISRALGVITSIVVARMLGITAFGEFTIVQSTVGLFGAFAGLGLGITATKYIAELRDTDPSRCGRMIGLVLLVATVGGLVAGAALTLFASWFATHALAAPQLAPLLRAGSALVFFGTLQGVYSGALGGFEAFKKVAHVNWMGAVFGAPLLVIATFAGGLQGAVWGSVLQIALSCIIGHLALLKEADKYRIKLSYVARPGDYVILWHFSLPVFLSSVLAGPANWICNTLLVNQDQGYKEIALLSAAGQWKNFLSFLPMMMTSVMVPMLSSLYHAGQGARFNQLLRRNLVINVGVCVALALPLVFLAPIILDWYGPGFRSGELVFVLSLSGTAVVAANNLLSRAMQASGRAWLEFTFSGLWVGVLVTGCFILVPEYKAVGLAVSHILAALLLLFWQWLMVRKLFSRPASTSSEISRPYAE